MEEIWRAGAVRFGLAESVAAAGLVRGTPKLAVVAPVWGEDGIGNADVGVAAYSMGKVHPALQLTGAVCLGAAVCVEGTVVHEIARPSRRSD
jgi:2-methylaconitate cis-trans-isomerase PrpF